MPIKISALLKGKVFDTIKNMPQDVDLLKVKGEPSFVVSKKLLSIKKARRENLYFLDVIRNGAEE